MPNFKTHNITGIITGSIITTSLIITKDTIHSLSFISMISSGIFCYLMSLFPDMDIKSKSSKLLYTLSLLVSIYLWYIGEFKILSIFLILLVIPLILSHRGFLHSFLAALLIPFSIFILFLQNKINLETTLISYFAGFIGYSLHLFLDKNG